MDTVQKWRQIVRLCITMMFSITIIVLALTTAYMALRGDNILNAWIIAPLIVTLGGLACAFYGIRSPSILLALAAGLSALIFWRRASGEVPIDVRSIIDEFGSSSGDLIPMEDPLNLSPPASSPKQKRSWLFGGNRSRRDRQPGSRH